MDRKHQAAPKLAAVRARAPHPLPSWLSSAPGSCWGRQLAPPRVPFWRSLPLRAQSRPSVATLALQTAKERSGTAGGARAERAREAITPLDRSWSGKIESPCAEKQPRGLSLPGRVLVLDAKDYTEGTWPATADMSKQALYRLLADHNHHLLSWAWAGVLGRLRRVE